MVAPHPPADGKLHDLADLAIARGMSAATLAGLCRANGWAHGKRVTGAEFDAAADKFQRRPMGSGRI